MASIIPKKKKPNHSSIMASPNIHLAYMTNQPSIHLAWHNITLVCYHHICHHITAKAGACNIKSRQGYG